MRPNKQWLELQTRFRRINKAVERNNKDQEVLVLLEQEKQSRSNTARLSPKIQPHTILLLFS